MITHKILTSINKKSLIGFAAALLLGFIMFRPPVLHAQSAKSISGTFVCLTNKNNSGYINAATGWSETDVNQLFTITFNGNTGTVSGLIINKVKNYERNDAYTESEITAKLMPMTVTPNTPAPYMYKLSNPTDQNKPHYLGLANNGNTLFILAAPESIQSPNLNGVCQKV
jgi:hypothetical protein